MTFPTFSEMCFVLAGATGVSLGYGEWFGAAFWAFLWALYTAVVVFKRWVDRLFPEPPEWPHE